MSSSYWCNYPDRPCCCGCCFGNCANCNPGACCCCEYMPRPAGYGSFADAGVRAGLPGPQGPVGPRGPAGPQGPSGSALNYADFYALMPPDNAATVAPGTDVSFPQDGPNSTAGIVRINASSFRLTDAGVYEVFFQVSADEAGQQLLTLNGQDLPYTVAGRATGTSEIVGKAIVETTAVNSILTVRNPAGNASALTITPLAGGTRPVSAHLVITQLR